MYGSMDVEGCLLIAVITTHFTYYSVDADEVLSSLLEVLAKGHFFERKKFCFLVLIRPTAFPLMMMRGC